MTKKTNLRLLEDAMKAYSQETTKSASWEREARLWHGRALKAEFVNEMTPWLVLIVMIGIVLVAYTFAI